MPFESEDLLKHGAAAGLAVAAILSAKHLYNKHKNKKIDEKYGVGSAHTDEHGHRASSMEQELERLKQHDRQKKEVRERFMDDYPEHLQSLIAARALNGSSK